MGEAIDRFFKVSERGSSLGTEVVAGFTTFLTMVYIVAVNPAMMQEAGMSFNAALTATCFGAAAMTLLMGLVANRPIALASGMGINAIVAYTLCGNMGLDWRVAMGVVFLEGLLILVLVLCGLREAIMNAVPVALRQAIGIGIGLFITFVGLKGGGVVADSSSTLVTLGDLTSPTVIVSLVSILLAVAFTVAGTKGGLLIAIVVATIVGIPLGVTALPTSFDFAPDFSAFAAPLQQVDGDGMALLQVLTQPLLIMFVFSLLMSNFFDAMGIMMAVGQQAHFVNEDGDVEDAHRILTIDAIAAAAGGFIGASSIGSYAESSSGTAAGARTGLSNVVIGVGFVVCAFMAPIVGMVSSSATCGALVVVGYLMLREIRNIDWGAMEAALPAFFIIVSIPFTYSIANGIGFGFIVYCLVKVVQGHAYDVKPLMWVVSCAFLVTFVAL